MTDTDLCAERQFIAQCGDVVLQQVHQTLEERVVLALHVRVPVETKDECKTLSNKQKKYGDGVE